MLSFIRNSVHGFFLFVCLLTCENAASIGSCVCGGLKNNNYSALCCCLISQSKRSYNSYLCWGSDMTAYDIALGHVLCRKGKP